MNNMETALICKALSDSNRIQIVEMLKNGEKCACKLLEKFQISQPTLSHHMRILCESGIVDVEKVGKWSHYSLNREKIAEFKAFIEELERGE